ncbi:MAG: 5,5-dehydrodivanillate O-demethylase oxygenase subunit [Actinomycetota bacterium]|nr:5,5-dehydrodivanillate O-demethylase oxygenase subunit [Actinomycetota bacterium]
MRIEPLAPGAIEAVEIDGHECVVWRGRSGRLGSGPRFCPHLDHDLAEGFVSGDELVCAGHGWAFDGAGHTYKRNEFGRADPKGTVIALTLKEDADGIDGVLP